MLYKLTYTSRKDNKKTFNALVNYCGKKYKDKHPMLKVFFINSCSEPYLENVKIGDNFIVTQDIDDSYGFLELILYEWKSSSDQKHYNFDVYHNYDNNTPNTILIKLNE